MRPIEVKYNILIFWLIISLLIISCNEKTIVSKNNLTDDERMEWWTEARFGMFIHWGLYAQDGCFFEGRDGRGEHMMRNLQIPVAKYEKIASEFNPVKFDANEWIKIAKDAGMKYMVFTSKHHDGFAMYNSPSSDYNIVDQLDSISCYLGVNAFYRQPELTDWFTARELIHYTWNDTGKHIQDSIHV